MTGFEWMGSMAALALLGGPRALPNGQAKLGPDDWRPLIPERASQFAAPNPRCDSAAVG